MDAADFGHRDQRHGGGFHDHGLLPSPADPGHTQGSAITFVILTFLALVGQERLRRDGSVVSKTETVRVRLSLWESVRMLGKEKALQGLFVVIFIATMAFVTHDVLLEPYGGEVLNMSVSATMRLTVLWGVSMILAWRPPLSALAQLSPAVLMAVGCVIGLVGFAVISVASDGAMVNLFRAGVAMISLGRGLFVVGSVILVMSLTDIAHAGLFLGIWGIVQAMAQGIGTIGGGVMRDVVQYTSGSTIYGYTAVYATSLLLLVVVLLLAFRLRRQLYVEEIRMPWSGLEEIPADQLAF
ncbi:MAG: PucC family protein [Caldilineaceae bacterium]